jgi:trehalose 6-phosphate synthase
VPEYQNLKGEIERLVAQINGQFTQPGWVPIHHVFRNIERQELLAWYRLADVGLVTPLKDGMNLVAKEYCACQIDMNGVLVLSEFAGASEQLGPAAVLVNPYDIDCVAAAIPLAAIMTAEERRPSMEKLRTNVRVENVYWWLGQFLKVCGVELGDSP